MLPVTSITAAILAIALVPLSIWVSVGRMNTGTRSGFSENPMLMQRVRAQANFTEYVPLALIVLGLAEYRGASTTWLWTIAGLLIAGRAFHAAGMLSGVTNLRIPGMIGTYLALLIGAAVLIFA